MGMAGHQYNEKGRAGIVFLCMIGVSLILVGGVFGWLMVRSYQNAKQSRDWPQVEVMVLRSDVDERLVNGSPREYRLNLLYGYSFGGQEISTNQFSPRGSKWTRDEASVQAIQGEYPIGSTHTAWVNPMVPGEAILKLDTRAAGYTLWFPALFMVGGAGMIWGALRKKA